MKISIKAIHILPSLLLIGCLMLSHLSFGQSSEEEIALIKEQRAKSNAALKSLDEELNNTFLTDDILITTGNGTLISGKSELNAYMEQGTGDPMYWVRTPDEIEVNGETLLAWESGTWKGYYVGKTEVIYHGKYSAQWTKRSGTWLMQSQLFVTLE